VAGAAGEAPVGRQARVEEQATPVYGAAEGLASVQGVAAVLLDDGAWRRVGSTFATGPNVPGSGPVLGWGASPTALYAIRAVEGGVRAVPSPSSEAATQPSTQATTQATTRAAADTVPQVTTAPATTRPAVPTLMLYDRGQWVGLADLPQSAAGVSGSLTVVGDVPVFAYQRGRAIETLAWADSRWQDWGQVQAGTSIGQFGLLGLPAGAAVWVVDLGGAIRLFFRDEAGKWGQAQGFALPADVAPDAQRSVTFAGEEIRLILAKDGKFWEQDYDLAGNPKGAKTELPAPAKPATPRGLWVFQLIVLGGMVLLLLVTYYRRKAAANSGNAEQE
jgi:hypothetical protein